MLLNLVIISAVTHVNCHIDNIGILDNRLSIFIDFVSLEWKVFFYSTVCAITHRIMIVCLLLLKQMDIMSIICFSCLGELDSFLHCLWFSARCGFSLCCSSSA